MYPNRVALSNDKGHTSIVSIARAKAIGTLQEDFSIGGGYGEMAARKKAFYILPGAYSMIGIGTIFR